MVEKMYTGDVEKTPGAGSSATAVTNPDPKSSNNNTNNKAGETSNTNNTHHQTLAITASNTNAPPPPSPSDPEGFNPPDGGLLAWSQVLTSLLINCLAWGYPTSFGVFQLYYEESMGLPSSQISWIGSCQTFLTFFVCGPAGRLADAGYTRETMLFGSVLAVGGTFATSACTAYWQVFLAQGVCTGIGLGVIFMPAVSVLSSYFRERKAFALALAAMGTGFGSLVFPATLQYLIPQVGFPWAVRCVGFVALAMTAAANLMLRPYLPPRRSGPLVEWDAFTELPYLFFSIGSFLNFYALYFGFFYVSPLPPILVSHVAKTSRSTSTPAMSSASPPSKLSASFSSSTA